jgi:uncharacterized membrane protein YhaH (DUF805 family)
MLSSLIEPFQRIFDYRGRSRRRDYWLFVAWQMPVVLGLLALGITVYPGEEGIDVLFGAPLAYAAVFGLPTLALQVRRLHDQDKSGWWLLVTLLPYLGLGWMLHLMLAQGTWGPNRYGPDPRQLWEGDLFE